MLLSCKNNMGLSGISGSALKYLRPFDQGDKTLDRLVSYQEITWS